MREIKFRIWDKETKHMHIFGDNIHDTIAFEGKTNKIYYYNLQNGCGSLSEDSDYVLMQYTGLKDKNGQEIYEGDIVYIKGETELLDIKGKVEYNDSWAQFVITNTGNIINETEPLGDYEEQDLEVIGNIYNNPELLKNRNIDKEE